MLTKKNTAAVFFGFVKSFRPWKFLNYAAKVRNPIWFSTKIDVFTHTFNEAEFIIAVYLYGFGHYEAPNVTFNLSGCFFSL